jgi:hypothetical protein
VSAIAPDQLRLLVGSEQARLAPLSSHGEHDLGADARHGSSRSVRVLSTTRAHQSAFVNGGSFTALR